MFYIIVSILTAIISGKLFKRYATTISFTKINMMSWSFYVAFISYCLIGATLVVLNLDDDIVNHLLNKPASKYIGYWSVIYTLLVFPLGMALSNKVFHRKNVPVHFENYISSPIDRERNDKSFVVAIIIFSIIDILLVAYVFKCYGTIPALDLLKNPGLETSLLRTENARDFSGSYSLRTIASFLTPLLAYTFSVYLARNPKNKLYRFWAVSMFIVALLMAASTYEKSSVFMFVLSYAFLWVYVKGKISKRVLVIGGVFALFILMASFALLSDGLSGVLTAGELFGMISKRIFLIQIESNFLQFENFPDPVPFIGFKSIFSEGMSDMLGLPFSEPSSRLMMEEFDPTGIAAGVAGVRNSLFISEAYANWGYLGAILSPLYVGFMVQTVFTLLLYSKKTPYKVALLVSFSINNHLTQGVNYYVFNELIVWIIIISFMIYFTRDMISYSENSKQVLSKRNQQ